jgi:hypothetical protein
MLQMFLNFLPVENYLVANVLARPHSHLEDQSWKNLCKLTQALGRIKLFAGLS